jgi:hypothetical protein
MAPRLLDSLLIGVFLVQVAGSLLGSALVKSCVGSPLEGLVLLAAAVVAFRVARALREVREVHRPWLLFALGLALFAVGEGWDAVYELPGSNRPVPAPPDIVYLAGYVVMAMALIGLLRAYWRSYPVSSGRELQLLALGLGGVLAAFGILVVRPVLERPLSTAGKIYLISYALLDIGLLAPIALLVRTVYAFRGGPVARAWGVLLAGFLFMTIADLLFGLTPWTEGTWLFAADETMYLAAYLLLVKGLALHRSLVA